MTSTEKKYKNREYYQSNREVIKNRAKERYHMRKKMAGELVASEKTPSETLKLVPETSAAKIRGVEQEKGKRKSMKSAENKQLDYAFNAGFAFRSEFECRYEYRDLKVFGCQSSVESGHDQENDPIESEEICRLAESLQKAPEKIQQSSADTYEPEKKEHLPERPKSNSWIAGIRRVVSSPVIFFQALFIIGLTSILTAMQIGFYRVHEIFPGLAVPLAVVCELSLLYLISLKSKGLSNLLRIGIYILLFGYIVSSLSFDVFFQSRNRLQASRGSKWSESEEMLKEQLGKAQASLEISTKGRSWTNMALFGEQVSGLQKRISEIHETKEFGVTDSETMITGAVLLVVLRALLMGVNSIAVCSLRNGSQYGALRK